MSKQETIDHIANEAVLQMENNQGLYRVALQHGRAFAGWSPDDLALELASYMLPDVLMHVDPQALGEPEDSVKWPTARLAAFNRLVETMRSLFPDMCEAVTA